MKLTKNFSLKEFLISRFYSNKQQKQVLKDFYKNRSGKSQHCLCKAADVKVKGYTPLEVYEAIEHLISIGKMKQGGLGKYNTFTHYDIRGVKARWDFRE